MNNIFNYSPKELTTDGFLNWLFCEFETNKTFRAYAPSFFHALGLSDCSNRDVHNISVTRQEKKADLIVRYQLDESEKQALFENKTNTTFHSGQLEEHQDNHPGFDHYIYLKLAYIYYSERTHAKKLEYKVIPSDVLLDALSPFRHEHCLTDMYCSFLKEVYVTPINKIKERLIADNCYQDFKDFQAQQYLLSCLHEKLVDLPGIRFKTGANAGGEPWTQLDIANRHLAYGDKYEYIFWRIDKRSRRYYLRLNQYANINPQFKAQKKANLDRIREVVDAMCLSYGLKLGSVSNAGIKESEIVIFFFDENPIEALVRALPELSRQIHAAYTKQKNWA